MFHFNWLLVFLFALMTSVSTAATQPEAPSHFTIGRGAIQSVAWHPGGNYLLVSTVTGAWLYTPDLQELVHLPEAQLAALSPDGRYIAGVDDTYHVRLWDAQTFEPVDSPDIGYFRRIRAIAWSPDGRYLAVSGSRDEDLVYVWDVRSRDTILATRNTADTLLWSPEGGHLALVDTQSGGVYVFNLDGTYPPFANLPAGRLPYGSDTIWKDETHLLTLLYYDEAATEATLWNVVTGEQKDTWRSLVYSPAYNHSGSILASDTLGGVAMFYPNSDGPIIIDTGPDHSGTLTPAWSRDDRWLAAGTYSYSKVGPANVLLIDSRTQEITHRLGGGQQRIQQLAWSSDDRFLLAVDAHQQLFVYDTTSWELLAYNDAHALVGETLAWRPDGSQLVVADSLGHLTLWDARQAEQIQRFPGPGLPVTRIKWQPHGDWIAVQARERDGTVSLGPPLAFQLWDTRTGGEVTDHFELESDPMPDFFAWHPDGSQLATLSESTLHTWDVGSGSLRMTAIYPQPLGPQQDLNWSPSGSYIAALTLGYGTGGSYIFDLETGGCGIVYASLLHGVVAWAPNDELISLAWGTWGDPTPPRSITPSLSRLVAPSFDYPAAASSRLIGLVTNTRQGFLSPHGRYAAAIDDGYSGMVWDATNGQPITMLADTAQIAWTPDETRFVIQRTDGSLWLLDANGTIIQSLSGSGNLQAPDGIFFWSPDGSHFAYLHNGMIDLWHFGD